MKPIEYRTKVKHLFSIFFSGLLLIMLLSPVELQAASNPTTDLAQRLLAIKSLSGKFQQTLASNNTIIQQSSGMFSVQAPGLFYWEVTKPYAQKIIVRDHQVFLIDLDLEQVTIRALDADNIDQFLVLLLTGSNAADIQKVLAQFSVSLEGQQVYHLVANNSDSLVSDMRLWLNAEGVITQIAFTNALEQLATITFSDLSVNKPIPLSVFNQEIPVGFDQVGDDD